MELFECMPAADQREGLAVEQTLRSWGHETDRSLLVAGLLHDVGKCLAPAGAPYRVGMTLLETLTPGLVGPLGKRSAGIRALSNHAQAGASMAADSGLPDDMVQLIAGHHSPPEDARMRALQRADALH